MDLAKYLNSMYGYVTVTLLFLAIVASFVLNQFPSNLILAAALAAIIDMLLEHRFLHKDFSFPKSAIITGLIIGSIAPITAAPIVVLVAVAAAMFSKFFIRLNNSHIFNPAAFGSLVGLAVFGLTDQWWPTMHYSFGTYMIVLTPLLIFANWKADKLKISIPFLVVFSILVYIGGIFSISTVNIATILGFLAAVPYFFTFVMVSEPKTSPYGTNQQIAFGVGVAIFTFAFLFYNVKYALFFALLAGNLLYALYRTYNKK